MRIPLSWAFAAAMAATSLPASAENFVLDFAPTGGRSALSSEEPSYERTGVDTHDVILQDVSASMSQLDINAATTGSVEHYRSDRAMADYARGICSKITVVYYAEGTLPMPPQIICSPEDVQKFADSYGVTDIEYVRNLINSSTNLGNGMRTTAAVFENDHTEGLFVGQRRVLIVTDETGGSVSLLEAASFDLTARFGATVSLITINAPTLAISLKDTLTTPEAVAREYNTLPGLSIPAANSGEVAGAVQKVMQFTQG